MTEIEKIFLDSLHKVVINRLPTTNSPHRYRHPDLYNIAVKAHKEGREYFYFKPMDPNDPNGRLMESEPIYVWKGNIELSEEEYESLCSILKASGKEN